MIELNLIELSVWSDFFHLYYILIYKKNHPLLIGIFEILISSFLCIVCNIMERKNCRKSGSLKFSLYETRTGSRRRRRARTVFTETQLEKLENQFQINQYADPFILETMSIKLNLDIDPIKVWFKNRRRREKAEIKKELRLPSINKFISPLHKQCSSINGQIDMIKGNQQNDICENLIKIEENSNNDDEIEIKNLSSCTENGSLIAFSDIEENNNNNNNSEGIKGIYMEHDLCTLYQSNNQHNKEVVKTIATLYSDYGSSIFHGSYIHGRSLNNPCADEFFSKYFSANNLQELACLLN